MRTKTTKEVEVMAFQPLSTWSIVAGASKELYKRYDTDILTTLLFLSWAYMIWDKLS